MEDLLLQTRTNDILKFPDELTNLTRGQRAVQSRQRARRVRETGGAWANKDWIRTDR
jgi:hypothetical protein